MKAVLVEHFGVENLEAAEAADPIRGQTGVFIATEAANVNPAEAAVPNGAAGATNNFQPRRSNSPHATIACRSGIFAGRGC